MQQGFPLIRNRVFPNISQYFGIQNNIPDQWETLYSGCKIGVLHHKAPTGTLFGLAKPRKCLKCWKCTLSSVQSARGGVHTVHIVECRLQFARCVMEAKAPVNYFQCPGQGSKRLHFKSTQIHKHEEAKWVHNIDGGSVAFNPKGF